MQVFKDIIGWDALEDNPYIADIEESRPEACPGCGAMAREGGRLLLVGHGSYERWVKVPREIRIRIRRYLCKRCRATTSVLPLWLLPRFQYTALVILVSLMQFHVEGKTAAVVTARFGLGHAKHGWFTLRRWGACFLVSGALWGWLGARLGVRPDTPWSRDRMRLHLERFVRSFPDPLRPRTPPSLEDVVGRSLRGMAFDGKTARSSLHAGNGRRPGYSPSASRLGPPTQRAGLPRDPP